MAARLVTVTQLDAARTQLDRAIALYLDSQDYLSAITLAGAADEVLGRTLEVAGGKHSLHRDASAVGVVSLKFTGTYIPKKDAIADLNEVRDWLKHYKVNSLTFDPQEAAAEMIDRAIRNLIALTNSASELVQRFDAQRRLTTRSSGP